MNATLVHNRTGQAVPTGAQLRMAANGTCWRHDGVHTPPKGDTEGSIHLSRMTRAGRQHRVVPPHMVDCHLTVDVRINITGRSLEHLMRHFSVHLGIWALEGAVAYAVAVFLTRMIGA
jgi:hypothetical protein